MAPLLSQKSVSNHRPQGRSTRDIDALSSHADLAPCVITIAVVFSKPVVTVFGFISVYLCSSVVSMVVTFALGTPFS
jgi:hypothetical protein